MNIRRTRIQQVLALFLRTLLLSNSHSSTIAVVLPGQYTNYLPQSYYSQSLSDYGNENQNYYNNPEAFHRQQFPPTSYGDSGGGLDEASMQTSYDQRNSFQPQSNYQEYLDGHFSPFRKEQDFALDNYGRHYATRQSAGESFDENFKNSETGHNPSTNDVLYPPLDHQMYGKHSFPLANYITANTTPLHPLASSINSLPETSYLDGERVTSKDTIPAANAAVHNTATIGRSSSRDGPIDSYQHHQHNQHHHHHPLHSESYFEADNPQQSQHQPTHHSESYFANNNNNNKLLSHSPSRTYYVTDSDPATSSTNYAPDSQPFTLHPNHLIQHPSASPSPLPAPPSPAFPLPGEPIPISKHVEITKHVPIPIYRQIHVPVRKPVHIEIPRPIISTISRPYPFQIPTITKTLAMPLVKEVKIPIEKVTPYPVEHRVPYVVEKRVPFQVEKQIPAPVFYPFPVRVPMVKTVIHKKKTHLPPVFHYHPKIHM